MLSIKEINAKVGKSQEALIGVTHISATQEGLGVAKWWQGRPRDTLR